ncbi:MAG: outer membrane lipid asymmetry maintenance protein MlaD [Succinivibrionaceae bacterium]|nr:outer membrane lipid asymmetry maintenance protein MlaD [Succinivibrionaceae bacterium]
MNSKSVEFLVGLFLAAGIVAAVILALKVAGLTLSSGSNEYYTVHAKFSNIGSLKVRSPVKLGGVVIGQVSKIYIDTKNLQPVVDMKIDKKYDKIGEDSTFSILTAGLLGEQYLGVKPDFASMDDDGNPIYLKDGSVTTMTDSAIVLEELLGKFLYSLNSGNKTE